MRSWLILLFVATVGPISAQPLELGARLGQAIDAGGFADYTFGLEAFLETRGRWSFRAAIDAELDFPGDPLGGWSGKAVKVFITVENRPARWLPELGYGPTIRLTRARHDDLDISVSSMRFSDSAWVGTPWRVGRWKPYAGLHLTDLLLRPGSLRLDGKIGLRVRL